MIIATINHQNFVLEDQHDAESLLAILGRAQPVCSTYDRERYFYPDTTCDVSVTITSASFVDMETHLARRQADEERTRKPSAAA